MRIDNFREIVLPAGFVERAAPPQTWRVTAAAKRKTQRATFRDLAQEPQKSPRGRIVDILV